MKVSKLAIAATLALGTTAFLATAPVDAQRADAPPRERNKQREQEEQPQQPTGPQLTREETAAVLPVQTAVRAQDWAAAAAALPAAQAAAQSPYARFVVARFQLQIARGQNNEAMQNQAIDAMLASGAAPAEFVPTLLAARASTAIQANDWPMAEQLLTRLVELEPNNADRLYQLAEVKIRLNKNNEALALYQRLLQAVETSGQQPTEAQIRRALELAEDQRQPQLSAQLSQRLLRSHPTTENWRTALVRLRQSAGDEAALAIDVRRLMRVAGAFSRSADYVEFANRLARTGQPGETKAVLDEGIARGTVSASDPDVRQMLTSANARIAEDRASLPGLRSRALAAATGREARIAGDTFYGYGEYAQAAELYRASLQKGGEDANLVNTRLGAALARAGQTAEAQAALRAVTGPRAALAGYWLLWLERGAQPAPAQPARPTQPAPAPQPNQQ